MSRLGRAVLTSFFGSTGDVAYLAGLGQGLQEAGYSVRMLLPKFFLQEAKPILDSMGLYDTDCVAASAPTLNEWHVNMNAGSQEKLRIRREFKQRERRLRSEMAATCIELVRSKDTQFIVGDVSSQHLIVPAYAAGIPYFQASPMPYIPTRHFYLGSRFPCIDKLDVWNSFRWTWGATPWQWTSHLAELVKHSFVDIRPSKSLGLARVILWLESTILCFQRSCAESTAPYIDIGLSRGYGTIHSALMTKRPLIIYPYQTDQFFLAKRMEQLSVALRYRVTLSRFSAQDFRRDLVQLSTDYSEMQKRVEQVREKIRQEDGIKSHVSRIETVLDKRRLSAEFHQI